MMAEKARLFGDSAAVDAIFAAPDPKAAKALGRKVKNFYGQLWAARCREIVTRGNKWQGGNLLGFALMVVRTGLL